MRRLAAVDIRRVRRYRYAYDVIGTAQLACCDFIALIDAVDVLRVGRIPRHFDGGRVERAGGDVSRRTIGHALLRAHADVGTEDALAHAVVGGNADLVLLEDDESAQLEDEHRVAGDVFARQRRVGVASRLVADDVTTQNAVDVVRNGRLPLEQDRRLGARAADHAQRWTTRRCNRRANMQV